MSLITPCMTMFFLGSALVAVAVPFPTHPCATEVRRNSGGTYFIRCDMGWDCGEYLCDIQDNQGGSVHYYFCGCTDGTSPLCNGWLKSTNPEPEAGGIDVGCFESTEERCPGPPQQVCDEEQVPVPPEGEEYGGWVLLCACKNT